MIRDKRYQRKKPVTFTRTDEIIAYLKMAGMIALAGGYLYLLFK